MQYAFGEFELDTARFELRRGTCGCKIERQVFDLLAFLVEQRDRMVTRDEIFAAVWPGRIVSDSALSSQIKAARKAIGDDGTRQEWIRTVRGRGFRFVGPVTLGPSAAPPNGQASALPAAPRPLLSQDIRYCMTPDGVRIAHSSVGKGRPLLKAATKMSDLAFDLESPIWRHVIEGLAQNHYLVRYDGRGNGLSDRDVDGLSFEDMVSDLESVADARGLETFALIGISQACAIAVEYAARHPERLSHLVLYGGYVKGWRNRGSATEIGRREALRTLIETDWGSDNPKFRQVFTSLLLPNGSPEQIAWFDKMQYRSISRETAARMHDAFGSVDVEDRLGDIETPTLVLHAREDSTVPVSNARLFASRIPDARLVLLESANHMLVEDDPAFAQLIDEVDRFLAEPGA